MASDFLDHQPQMAPHLTVSQATHTGAISGHLPDFPLATGHSLRSLGLQPGFLGLGCSAQMTLRVESSLSFLMNMRPTGGWALAR